MPEKRKRPHYCSLFPEHLWRMFCGKPSHIGSTYCGGNAFEAHSGFKNHGVFFQPIIAIANVPNVWSSSLYCLQLYHKSRLFAIDSDVFLKKYE